MLAEMGGEAVQEEEPEDEVPFACLICRQDFKDPIVTKCGHYFCQNCAIQHHRKSPKCFACGTPTGGTFTIARELVAKLAERKRRMEEQEKEDRAKNEALVGSLSEEDDEEGSSSDSQ